MSRFKAENAPNSISEEKRGGEGRGREWTPKDLVKWRHCSIYHLSQYLL